LQGVKMQDMKMHDFKLQDLTMTEQTAFGRYMTKFLIQCLRNLVCAIYFRIFLSCG